MRVDGIVYADAPMMSDDSRGRVAQTGRQRRASARHRRRVPGDARHSLGLRLSHRRRGRHRRRRRRGVAGRRRLRHQLRCAAGRLAPDTADVTPRLREIVKAMYQRVPTGVGAHRRDLRLSQQRPAGGAASGARSGRSSAGSATADDLDHIEEGGMLRGCGSSAGVRSRARARPARSSARSVPAITSPSFSMSRRSTTSVSPRRSAWRAIRSR